MKLVENILRFERHYLSENELLEMVELLETIKEFIERIKKQ